MAVIKAKAVKKANLREAENEELKNKIALIEEVKETVQLELLKTVDEICENNARNFVTKEESNTENQKLLESMQLLNKEITSKLDHMIKINHKVETKNIRHIIVQFADDLRNGSHRSEVSYRSILEYYDYYKNHLKENSYIDKEIAFIKDWMAKNHA